MRRRRRSRPPAGPEPTSLELARLVDAVEESYRQEAIGEPDRRRQRDLLIAAATARGIAAAIRRR